MTALAGTLGTGSWQGGPSTVSTNPSTSGEPAAGCDKIFTG
jgi:hypothetical protein